MKIEKKIILKLIYNQDVREEIFGELGEEYFEEYNIFFKLIKDMYVRKPNFTEVEAITTLRDLGLDGDNEMYSKEIYETIKNLKTKDLIRELKKNYANNRLFKLEGELKTYLSNGKDIREIIQHINTVVSDIEGGHYVKPFYKVKKSNEVYIDKSIFAEWLINKYHIYYENRNFRMYQNGVYKEIEDDKLKKIILTNLDGKFKSDPINIINKVLEIMKYSEKEGGIKKLNLEENINFKNCILNVYDNKIIEHTPKLISNIQMNANYCKDAK